MKRYTIQPYAIHMAFTATVLSPDADTQATVESEWEAGAEYEYGISSERSLARARNEIMEEKPSICSFFSIFMLPLYQ